MPEERLLFVIHDNSMTMRFCIILQSPTITKKFAPDDVMNYGDGIGNILVTDLKRTKKFLEVYVMEVFNPSFFWIHLRENRKRFNKMMEELQ